MGDISKLVEACKDELNYLEKHYKKVTEKKRKEYIYEEIKNIYYHIENITHFAYFSRDEEI
jgi:hypothetical protein